MTYESCYESPLVKKNAKRLNISECIEVNPTAAFGEVKHMSNMKKS